MTQHRLEVADVFRQYGENFLSRWGHTLSAHQRKALRDIGACRTAALGGHVEQCDTCSHRLIAYNSCRNRHCPKCQSTARDRWLAERAQELLPLPYAHVVFTVPEELVALARQQPRLFYGLLFRAVSQTLLQIAANPQHLGADIGFLAVLHTWAQNLLQHPHVHCLVPAGGIAFNRSRWIPCRRKFFLPVRVLSRLFRGKLLTFLREAYDQGKLHFHGQMTPLADAARFHSWLCRLRKKDWVVYAKPPFGGPQHLLKYLARYTHRVAISNGRLLDLTNGRIRFRWRDSKDGNRIKVMALDAIEFIRRFLLHVLPPRFIKIRHFGFLANRNRSQALAFCRQHLQAAVLPHQPAPLILSDEQQRAIQRRCPLCHNGVLRILTWLSAEELAMCDPSFTVHSIDSS